jgi:hypothetical protein
MRKFMRCVLRCLLSEVLSRTYNINRSRITALLKRLPERRFRRSQFAEAMGLPRAVGGSCGCRAGRPCARNVGERACEAVETFTKSQPRLFCYRSHTYAIMMPFGPALSSLETIRSEAAEAFVVFYEEYPYIYSFWRRARVPILPVTGCFSLSFSSRFNSIFTHTGHTQTSMPRWDSNPRSHGAGEDGSCLRPRGHCDRREENDFRDWCCHLCISCSIAMQKQILVAYFGSQCTKFQAVGWIC